MSGFVRSISFIIPGDSGSPGVEVSIEEQGGALRFDLRVLGSGTATGDLRALFFRLIDASESKLAGMKVTWHDGTVTDFQAQEDRVIDLGGGANMTGTVSKTDAFDVGVELGTQGIGRDDIQDASFVLSNAAGNLTLDDVSQTLFGARLTSVGTPDGTRDGSVKLTSIAPAAPDARDDSFHIFEDGASGTGDARAVAAGIVFAVLANDTDADGNRLTVTALAASTTGTTVTTATGGTVVIIDGDGDGTVGDAILYTPLTDFSGTDSFQYLVSDGAGGTDFATVLVSVAAVADVPTLTYELFDTGIANQVKLVVTAAQTDDDLSEFIDSLAFLGNPGTVTVVANDALDPAGQPASLAREFLVTLPVAASAFTLDVTATSKEVSNGDTEAATVGVNFYGIFEDGAAGLAAPAGDTAGATLVIPVGGAGGPIASIGAVAHGTAVLNAAGDAVLYTPTTDYAGWDSFTYTTASGETGQASITVNAVADIPDVTYEIIAGNAVNAFTIRVTATQTDNDGSEYIDSLAWSVAGGLPQGVTITPTAVDPADRPGQVVRDFDVILPIDTDTSFDLVFNAVSKEVSNDDTLAGSATARIDYTYTRNDLDTIFEATDQSIWDSGAQTTLVNDTFLGFEESWSEGFGTKNSGDVFYGATSGNIRAGFQSTLTFEGGGIDAAAPYDVVVDSNYNRTTDVLVIGTSASLLDGGGFTTTGPQGSYGLDFIFEFGANVTLGVNVAGTGYDFVNIDVGPYDERLDILTLESSALSTPVIKLPAGFSLQFAWPTISTTSDGAAPYEASGASNDFAALNLDIDDLLTKLLGLPVNPFAPSVEFGVDGLFDVEVTLNLVDIDIGLGLNFLQEFALAVNDLTGTITYENGVTSAITIGQDIVLENASDYDLDGDGVEYTISLDPQATLENSTELGFNFLWSFDLLSVRLKLSVIDIPVVNQSTPPLLDLGDSIPLGSIEIYSNSFALDFQSQDYALIA